MIVPKLDVHAAMRERALSFEAALPSAQRKRLGQFFTGLPLGKLLAHLALTADTRTVLDPMAGHGDILDATWQASIEMGVALSRLDGVEIEPTTAQFCDERLDVLIGDTLPVRRILTGDAFDLDQLAALGLHAYDLVITNPPYVRYQGRTGAGARTDVVRAALRQAIKHFATDPDALVWQTLVDSYSGFSDLSVPSWLLASLLVRPGGRLALVAPATWRSRDYADVVRYLLLRCFAMETIVEDSQPGWFSNALVRTHLIVARRLDTETIRETLGERKHWPSAKWIRISPCAANENSLVGAAFVGDTPEAEFAAWLNRSEVDPVPGIEVGGLDLTDEWSSLRARVGRQHWYKGLEGRQDGLRLSASASSKVAIFLPPAIGAMLQSPVPATLGSLEEIGIRVGQGLRTGCNTFFYVEVCGAEVAGLVPVRGAAALGAMQFVAPASALRPVIRGQADAQSFSSGEDLRSRVLDLRHWVLPEDYAAVRVAQSLYAASREQIPKVMPDGLAAFVRRAAAQRVEGSGTLIPDLTAVRTNVRAAGRRGLPPRFWYMLPDFAPRHLPAAFIARVIHEIPWAECNSEPPVLVDANFSTFWSEPEQKWTRYGIKALLNSTWCRTLMEALGTPLGGGALKLEATHLRRMPVPMFTDREKHALDRAGKRLHQHSQSVQVEVDEIVLGAVVRTSPSHAAVCALMRDMEAYGAQLRAARRRVSTLCVNTSPARKNGKR